MEKLEEARKSARFILNCYTDCQIEAMLSCKSKRKNNDRKVKILKLLAAGLSCSEIGIIVEISGTRVYSEIDYSLRKLYRIHNK